MSVAARPRTIPPGEPDAAHVRHLVTALVVDRPGTLNRVSGLLRARSFNIESLTVGATEQDGRSRMTIALRGDEGHLRQVLAQLERLIEVLEVQDLHDAPHIELELALIEVEAPRHAEEATELETLVAACGGEILDAGERAWRARLTASPQRIDAAVEQLRGKGLRGMVRAGAVALVAPSEPEHPERENGARPA